MADINNTFGLDASGAINELNKLDAATDRVNASLTQLQVTATGTVETPFENITKNANAAGKAGTAATSAIGKGAAAATKQTRGLALSMGDVARIVQSQIIFAALAELKQGFFEAADAAAELQLQVQRISAIAPDFSNVRGEIEQLAIDLGRPLAEVGEAAFEALQNDIGDTGETLNILRNDAQELALVTGGTLPQAVNALSSVLKSYNEEQLAGVDIAGQFFGTINAGRITLADLENSLGTLLPLASQVGTDFTEVTDALATITLSGTKASVATTQLRNVFNKLIKPTKALSAVYQELGVEGFSELQERTGGLVPALQELVNAVDGDEEAVARLFNTIRGNLGVLNTLAQEGQLFRDTAERSAESALRLQDAIDAIDATPAREAARNAAELEVILTQIGDDALDLKVLLGDIFLEVIEDGAQAELALVAVAGAFTTAAIAVKGFGVSLKTALPFLAAFLAGIAIGEGIIEGLEALQEAAGGINDEFAQFEVNSLKEVVETIKDINADGIKELNKEFSQTGTLLNDVLSESQKVARGIESAFDKTANSLRGVEEGLLDRFGEQRKRILDEIEKAIDDIDKEISQGTQNIADLRQELADFSFERGLRDLSEAQQVAERLKKSVEDIAAANDAINNVGLGKASQEAAEAAAATARSSAEAALAAADREGNVNNIAKAEARVQEAITAEINLERELNRLRNDQSIKALEQQQQAAEALNADQKQALEDALATRKELEEAIKSGADESIVAGLDEQFGNELKKALDGLDAFAEQEIVKAFGFDKAANVAADQIREGLSDLSIDWANTLNGLQEALTGEQFEAAVNLTAAINADALAFELQRAIALATREGGTAADELQQTAGAVKDVAAEQLGIQNQIEEGAAKAKASSAEALALLKEAGSLEFGTFGKDSPSGRNLAQQITEPAIAAVESLGTKTEEELIGLQTGFVEAIKVASETGTGLFGELSQARKEELVTGLNAALDAVQARLAVVRAQGLFDPQALAQAQDILSNLNALGSEEGGVVLDIDTQDLTEADNKLKDIKIDADDAALSTASIGTAASGSKGFVDLLSTSTGGLSTQADSAAGAFRRLEAAAKAAAEAARDANSASSGGNLFFGGQVNYRQGGGETRGQDTVPSMLSPGEFVTSARQTRNFLPQLQAINAGNAPSGGSTNNSGTNITIGDVNVTSTSQVPTQTGREIATALKRELRRGTTRL